MEDSWYEVKEGDVLYAPCHIRHGTRNNNESGEPFICTGAAALPQMDLCRLAGYL